MPCFGAAYASLPTCCASSAPMSVELNWRIESRINVECGTTDLRELQAAVRGRNSKWWRPEALLGCKAFDGDDGPALFVDERAHRQRGSRAVSAIGVCDARARGADRDTIFANGDGPYRLRARAAKPRHRTDPNCRRDRSCSGGMPADGYTLGGEQSGHLIDLRYNTTATVPRSP